MKVLLVFCLLVGAAVCSLLRIPANPLFDGLFVAASKVIPASYPLERVEISGMQFGAGQVIGMNSVVRTGPSFMLLGDDNTVGLNVHVGLSFVTLVFPSMEVNGQRKTGIISVSGLSAHIEFMVHPNPCKVEFTTLNFEPGLAAVLYSSEPEYDGKNMTAFIKEHVLSHFENDKRAMQGYMSLILCERSKGGNQVQALLAL